MVVDINTEHVGGVEVTRNFQGGTYCNAKG